MQMKYRHQFRLRTSIRQVADFHRLSASMAAITPPPIVLKVQQAPSLLADGDKMAFTMWLGPLPIQWLARIESVSPSGFTDRQIHGPFAEWVHRHTFFAIDENLTDVVDEITLQFRSHALWWPIGLGMWLSLPLLFAFRAAKTRRLP
jgi:ligand-binding SRPBCC domain-containing protein